jgi:N-hydroxyarylamine O-acetyltransferase
MSASYIGAYLRRLRIAEPGRPSVAALHALHAAHVERVAYEALDVQLGLLSSIEPDQSAERIALSRRGGYCYHLNGGFSELLRALGYDVVWHRAGVQGCADATPAGAVIANHLALTVHGLVSEACPAGTWLVDVGLGDALHEPLPLHEGTYVQGPFRYQIRRSDVEPDGWRLDHDPRGSFAGMDFAPRRATVGDFTERHLFLSTAPESSFVRTCAVQRRDALGADVLTGCVLRRLGDPLSRPRTLETRSDWFGALAEVFDLPLTDLDATARNALWARVRNAHEAWLQHHRALTVRPS